MGSMVGCRMSSDGMTSQAWWMMMMVMYGYGSGCDESVRCDDDDGRG